MLLRMRNVSNKSCRENQNTHFMLNNLKKRAIYEKMWKKYGRVGLVTDNNIIRRRRFACRNTKATDTHSEYVTLIAFLRRQWLRERV
jgi:hypothetical protein